MVPLSVLFRLSVDSPALQDHCGARKHDQDSHQLLRCHVLIEEEHANEAAEHRHQQQVQFDQPHFKVFEIAIIEEIDPRLGETAQEKYHEDADMISYYNNFVVLLLFGTSSAAAAQFRPGALSLGSIWWLVALGGLAQTGIYFFYYRNLKHFEVWLVKLYLLLMPVLSCFIGVFFLNEELTVKKLFGILIVLCGAAVIVLRGRINHEGRPKRA